VQQLVERLCRQLHPGGYLIIGHAENLNVKPRDITSIRTSIFKKAWK